MCFRVGCGSETRRSPAITSRTQTPTPGLPTATQLLRSVVGAAFADGHSGLQMGAPAFCHWFVALRVVCSRTSRPSAYRASAPTCAPWVRASGPPPRPQWFACWWKKSGVWHEKKLIYFVTMFCTQGSLIKTSLKNHHYYSWQQFTFCLMVAVFKEKVKGHHNKEKDYTYKVM